MNTTQIDNYLLVNGKNFKAEDISPLRNSLLRAEESKTATIHSVSIKDPVVMLIISLFLGYLGVDRFLLGQILLGVLKLITCGGFGVWAIIDWFLIMNATRSKNYENVAKVAAGL